MPSGTQTFEGGTVPNDVTTPTYFDELYLSGSSTFKFNATAHLGSKSGLMDFVSNNFIVVAHTFGASVTTCYMSFYVYIRSAGNTLTSHHNLGFFTNNAAAYRGFVGVNFADSRKLTIGNSGSSAIASSSAASMPQDEWVRIDHIRNATTLTVRAYKGGTLESPNTADAFISLSATSDVGGTDRYYYGNDRNSPGSAGINWDSIAWDTDGLPAPRGTYTAPSTTAGPMTDKINVARSYAAKPEVQGALNRIRATSGVADVQSLNRLASPGRAQNLNKDRQGVLNELAGTSGLGEDAAAALINWSIL